MTKKTTPSPAGSEPPGPRQHRILEAAAATFIRFGYRKTSVEEVARAAHLSRQALYLHFKSKEELFRATLTHTLETGIAAAQTQLQDQAASLESKLIGAFRVWMGRHAGLASEGARDLEEMSALLVGPLIPEYEERFVDMVAKAIRAAKLPMEHGAARISARQLAEVLHATAHGLKTLCRTPADFDERLAVAVRALCRS